jgi:hypothetical protein
MKSWKKKYQFKKFTKEKKDRNEKNRGWNCKKEKLKNNSKQNK